MYDYRIGQERIAVKVEHIKGKKYQIIPGEIVIIKSNTKVAELSGDYEIINEYEEKIMPTGKFLITTETIDPYHLIIDMF